MIQSHPRGARGYPVLALIPTRSRDAGLPDDIKPTVARYRVMAQGVHAQPV